MANSTLPTIVAYYLEYKTAIFTSSLTLGTFLFTMKTFVIQTMKREVYDSAAYQKMVSDRIEAGSSGETYYGQLANFKQLLFYTIIFSFSNALLQLILGYFRTVTTTIICFATTGVSWSFAIWALILVSKNLSLMIDISEKNVKKKMVEINKDEINDKLQLNSSVK